MGFEGGGVQGHDRKSNISRFPGIGISVCVSCKMLTN